MPKLEKLQEQLLVAGDSRQWREISGLEPSSSLVTTARRSRIVKLSRALAAASPLYARLIGAILDMLAPPGIQLLIPRDIREELRLTVDWFWENGPAALRPNMRALTASLLLDGELLLLPRINTGDGRVTLTYLRPDYIEEVFIGEGLASVKALKLAESPFAKRGQYETIRRGVDGKLGGDIFYFRVLPIGYTAGYRGLPLLTAMLDEVSAVTEFFYHRTSRLDRLSTFYWDVTLKGATQDHVDTFLKSPQATPPEAGELFAHNEQVDWELVTPRVSQNVKPELRLAIDFLAGAAGLSPEFLGYTPGRDITTEALFSAISHLDALRAELFGYLTLTLQFQLEQTAAKSGAVSYDDIPQFEIIARQIGTRSMQRAAQAFIRYADGLAKAVKEGLLDKESAGRVLRYLLVQLGLLPELAPGEAPGEGQDVTRFLEAL